MHCIDAAREVNGHAGAVSDTVHGMLVPQVELPVAFLSRALI